jgi:hypothetical protein
MKVRAPGTQFIFIALGQNVMARERRCLEDRKYVTEEQGGKKQAGSMSQMEKMSQTR